MSLRILGTMLLLGVFSYMITVFNLSSIIYIPVSLTTIVFYTHPALVVLATAAVMRSRVNPVEFTAVAAAFCSLFIALEVSFTALHPLGLGFAGASALTVAVMYVVSNRLLDATDFIEVTFYMALSAAALSALTLLPEDGMAMPLSLEGTALVALVTVLFMIAITTMFLSIELVGSVPTSMLTNVEPLTAIAVLGARCSVLGARRAAARRRRFRRLHRDIRDTAHAGVSRSAGSFGVGPHERAADPGAKVKGPGGRSSDSGSRRLPCLLGPDAFIVPDSLAGRLPVACPCRWPSIPRFSAAPGVVSDRSDSSPGSRRRGGRPAIR